MEKILKICLIASLLGVLLLIILSQQLGSKLVKINQIDKEYLGVKIGIIGEIISISNYDGFQVLLIKDETGTIKVTADSKKPLNKTRGNLTIIGKVVEYKEEIEIQSDKIIKM